MKHFIQSILEILPDFNGSLVTQESLRLFDTNDESEKLSEKDSVFSITLLLSSSFFVKERGLTFKRLLLT